ncbi:RICIN domain-containing protein [Streptomyces sp. BPTC-684]|uniref:RICIN domain-containing protein n=1 Tax=Streptomyces sp. BPTC-684 TaxID=3043734 RepID=UPI0024B0FC39|nr:RICIN domain-containing protein [Streptomyces sp. BPTC-684]WHM40922.1 RICIN domain-containing protein [Streptomyces sp. BPTC-684]
MHVRRWLVAIATALALGPGTTAVADASPQGTSSAGWQPQPGATYQFTSRWSGRCLDVAGTGDFSNVRQWDCVGDAYQRWTFENAGGGYYYVHPAFDSGMCLDVDTRGANGDFGGNVHLYHCWQGQNQMWRPDDIGDGWSSVIARHNGKALDVDTRAGNINNANVHNFTYWGGNNQMWRITPV